MYPDEKMLNSFNSGNIYVKFVRTVPDTGSFTI